MLPLILNIVYVLIAIGMVILILLQRGAGAQAGSGFGAGASGTVFGARGASNFMSKSTRWLAIAFFGITLLMAWMHVHGGKQDKPGSSSLMTQAPAAAKPAQIPIAPVTPQIPSAQPAATSQPAAIPSASPATAPAATAQPQAPQKR